MICSPAFSISILGLAGITSPITARGGANYFNIWLPGSSDDDADADNHDDNHNDNDEDDSFIHSFWRLI